jgi:alpha-beta hydrolase superfamily lysophospholipase
MVAMKTTQPSSETAEGSRTGSMRRWRRLLGGISVLLGLYVGLCTLIAWETVRAKQHHLRHPTLEFEYESIVFTSADGTRLHGWFMPAKGRTRGVVVCCHGVDSTRLAMVEPARILHDAGYAVVLFDFRARGESEGTRCTLGYRETDDLLAAIAYAQGRSDVRGLPIGVLGESMGGAVALMGTARSPAVRCVIAESPFASLDHAVANHFGMLLGGVGPILGVPTRWIGERLIGISCVDVAPIREIGRIAPRPMLLIEDGADRLCPSAETRSLFGAAGAPKQIWTVPGADHIGAIITQPDEYARRITAFFDANLVDH